MLMTGVSGNSNDLFHPSPHKNRTAEVVIVLCKGSTQNVYGLYDPGAHCCGCRQVGDSGTLCHGATLVRASPLTAAVSRRPFFYLAKLLIHHERDAAATAPAPAHTYHKPPPTTQQT